MKQAIARLMQKGTSHLTKKRVNSRSPGQAGFCQYTSCALGSKPPAPCHPNLAAQPLIARSFRFSGRGRRRRSQRQRRKRSSSASSENLVERSQAIYRKSAHFERCVRVMITRLGFSRELSLGDEPPKAWHDGVQQVVNQSGSG